MPQRAVIAESSGSNGTMAWPSSAGRFTVPAIVRLGFVSTFNGQLELASSGHANLATFTAGALTGNRAYTCPDANGQLALTSQIPALSVPVTPAQGGTGIANNNACTTTRSGNFALTLTLTNTTSLTLPVTGTLATLAGSETLSGKTLTAPRLVSGGFIADANGSEGIILVTVASAINEITVTNAAAAGHPSIAATGGGTNINLALEPKGTGQVSMAGAALAVSATAISATVAIDAAGGLDVSGGSLEFAAVGPSADPPFTGTIDTAVTPNLEVVNGVIIGASA